VMKRWSDEAMKRWSDEAMKRWSDEAIKQDNEALNASWLQVFSSIKRLIASSLQICIQRSTLHRRYFLRKIII
jgi:hypothetical protein